MKIFWLLSDGKTVREITPDKAQQLLSRQRKTKGQQTFHLVYLHSNFDLYTTRPYIPYAQLKQILANSKKEGKG